MQKFFRGSCMFLALVQIIIFSGCGYSYRMKPIKPLQTVYFDSSKQLSCAAKLLTNKECRRVFGKRITKKGFRVIQLCVANNSLNNCFFYGHDINMHIIDRPVIAQKLSINARSRVATCGLISLLFSPLFLVPTAILAVSSSNSNDKLANDFAENVIGLEDRVNLFAGSTITKLIFVREHDIPATVSINVHNKTTDAIAALNCVLQ